MVYHTARYIAKKRYQNKLACQREYYWLNRDEIRARQHDYYMENREYIIARNKENYRQRVEDEKETERWYNDDNNCQ